MHVLDTALLKRASLTSCPYDLAEFGGIASYVSHWRLSVRDGGPGHCFPSGHASAGLAFLSVYFGLRRSRAAPARAALAAVLLLGACLGLAQMARGAHDLSHSMWTAWLCWVCCAAGWRLLPAARTAG